VKEASWDRLEKIAAFFAGCAQGFEDVCSVIGMFALLSFFWVACGGTSTARPACDPSASAKLEAQFVAELVAACGDEEGELEQCSSFESIREKYREPRLEAMKACQ
jgi:hypothetical protein